jgi:hypothetical protein
LKKIHLGAGAGYSGDRIEPAVELAEKGDIQYLVFECLAERTTALAQGAKLRDPQAGYDPLLAARMKAVLAPCRARGIKIITNMGAANPIAAAEKVAEIARGMGLKGLKIAAVTGDDVFGHVRNGSYPIEDTGAPVSSLGERMVSANAYMGAQGIVDALAWGADIVVTGRVSDPALFLAPQVHELGWSMDDCDRLGKGVAVGHLLECAAQVTGGYFADPGYKDVPDLARVGFPIAEVSEDGTAVITKVPGSGGMVTRATCSEQLLYEIHDPTRYFQPDVVADFSRVTLTEEGKDRVRVAGATGSPRTGTLKVTVGYRDSFIGEGEISYAGPGAAARGRLALEVLEARLKSSGLQCREVRGELIGVDSVLGPKLSAGGADPKEVRLRFAARTDSLEEAILVGNEVEALYLNGPAGGGGARSWAKEVIGVVSVLIPENLARHEVHRMQS